MRAILFRGKRIDNGEWAFGYVGVFKGITQIYVPFSIEEEKENEGHIFSVAGGTWNTVDPATVGQFTGLTDKNGVKIFEGDIVAQNWYDYTEPSDDSFGEVVFCEYDCSFSVLDKNKDGIVPLGRCHAYHWEAEVIGNIHDNPELLEVRE